MGLQQPVNQLFKRSMYSVKKYLIWAFSFSFWQCTLKIENAACSVHQIRALIASLPSSSPFYFLRVVSLPCEALASWCLGG